MRRWGPLAVVSLLFLALPVRAAGRLERISVSSREQGANEISITADITADGSKVVFFSSATNLARKGAGHAYLRDRRRGRTILVSRNSRGRKANKGAVLVRISPNGRFVTFCSESTNIVTPDRWKLKYPPPERSKYMDVFVRDLRTGVTRRASSSFKGGMADGFSCSPEVSNGGDVVFESGASNLIRRDDNNRSDIFVYDWSRRRVKRVSVSPRGREANGPSRAPGISANGRWVLFASSAPNFDKRPNAPVSDIWLHSVRSRRTSRVPEPKGIGDAGNCNIGYQDTHLSHDGRYLLIACWHMWNRPEGLQSGAQHLYRFDRASGRFVQITPIALYEDSGGPVWGWDLTQDGRFVSWCSTNVYDESDDNGADDVFLADLERDVMRRMDPHPTQVVGYFCRSTLAEDARAVAFETLAPMKDDDTNETADIYLQVRPLS